MQDLSRYTALITGAGARIGKAIALDLLARGATVVVHYRESSSGAGDVLASAASLPGRAVAVQTDLSDPAATELLIARAADAAGRPLDWLVNNASVFENVDLADTTLDVWDRNVMVNLTAPFILSRDFAAHRRAVAEDDAEPTGAIVNMLDFRATHPGADHFAYTISKAGLAAMTRSLARALAPRMRCNGIALGSILPPIYRSPEDPAEAGQKEPRGSFSRTPAGRRGTLEEVCETVAFLLAGPGYITGDILYLDGGRRLT